MQNSAFASLLLLCLVVTVAAASAQTPDRNSAEAEKIYAERCAKCHESGVPRAANREALRRLSPDAVRLALTSGSMLTQAVDLSPAQIDILARMLGSAADRAAGIYEQRVPGRRFFFLRGST